MQMRNSGAALTLAAFGCADALRTEINPVTRVVHMLDEMKEQVQAEYDEDKKIYENHDCWCKTNEEEKTNAVKYAKERLEDLAAAIEEGTSRMAKLKTEIGTLEDDIAEDEAGVKEAEGLRAKETAEFDESSEDSMESITLLKQALDVLDKVQLVQKQDVPPEALIEVKNIVSKAKLLQPTPRAAEYKNVLQRDLWDMLGATGGLGRSVAGLDQQPAGAAAGAKSHNSASGQIVGILAEMKDELERDLSAAQKANFKAEEDFQKLQAAKTGEIQAAQAQADEKSEQLAQSEERVAQAKVDVTDTEAQLDADEQFLVDLEGRCKNADTEYQTRQQTRQDEMLAISETINILTTDQAKDLRGTTAMLLQLNSVHKVSQSLNSPLRSQAATPLIETAHKLKGSAGSWELVALAVNVKLDGFEKIKAKMDNMIAKLKQQQSDEVEKRDNCAKDINDNEGEIRVKNSKNKDLNAQITDLDANIEELTSDLANLKLEITDMILSLKRAGEDRKENNKQFQQTIADQRATIVILNKALTKLKSFYGIQLSAPKMLLQRSVRSHKQDPPPAEGKEYEKNAASGGVMSTIEMIIQDAEKADDEAIAGEQESQAAYAELVKNTNEALDAANEATAQKKKDKQTALAAKDTAEEGLMANVNALEDLHGINTGLHKQCDYILKFFNVRQKARGEEIESIKLAKAILSGAV